MKQSLSLTYSSAFIAYIIFIGSLDIGQPSRVRFKGSDPPLMFPEKFTSVGAADFIHRAH